MVFRNSLFLTLLSLLFAGGTAGAAELIVKPAAGFLRGDVRAWSEHLGLPGHGEPMFPGAQVESGRGLGRIYRWHLPENENAEKWAAFLNRQPGVEYAETPRVRYLDDWPNDGDGLYALELVNAAAAWDLSHGSREVVVAVVDNGTDWQHEDLEENIYINTAEADGAPGVDDDNNGFVDDIHGWDFYDQDNDPTPAFSGHSHGTHVAGTVSAVTDNGLGVAAIAWNVSVMPVRAGYSGSIYNGYEGIHYAAHNGAQIINLSWGGSGYSAFENDVVQDALDQGAVLVAAAGNEHSSIPHFPAAYDGVIAVANVDQNDVKSGSSNFGTWVDVCAPGVNIYSLVPGNGYEYKSGTSMAAPQVSSLAGLLWSRHPDWNSGQVAQQVIFSAQNVDAVNPEYAGLLGRGRIDAFQALGDMVTAVRLTDLVLDDASGDGILDPGETVTLQVELTNFLAPVSDVQCLLQTTDPWITVSQNQFNCGALPTGGTCNGELEFAVTAEAPPGHSFTLELVLSADGGTFTISEFRSFTVLPLYGDHDNSNVKLTVTAFGALGYYDNQSGGLEGSGFQYPINNVNSLWHGSLLVGTDGEHVSDCASWNQSAPYDFVAVPEGQLAFVTDGERLVSTASFTDAESENALDLEVSQQGVSLDTPDLEDGVLLSFNIRNTGEEVLTGVSTALWLDYDVLGDYNDDLAGWDEERGLGYQYDDNGIYLGVAALGTSPASYRVIDNNTYIYEDGFRDPEKYQFMTEGFVVTQGTEPRDWSILLALPPLDLDPAAAARVTFVVLGGEDLADLQANYDSFAEYFSAGVSPPSAVAPQSWELIGFYPNPFNPSAFLELQVTVPTVLEMHLTNLLGQMVWRRQGLFFPGKCRVEVAPDAATGTYFLSVKGDGRIKRQKVLLVK